MKREKDKLNMRHRYLIFCLLTFLQAEDMTLLAPDGSTIIIHRDDYGVPHIKADNEAALFFGQGFAEANDRLYQIDLNRRAATGRLAEWFGDVALDVESRGAITFFDHEARNLRLIAEFTGLDNPESRYLRHWTDAYDMHRATGDSSEYIGFGPNGRLSGAEGMTIHPSSSNFHLDVILQQVVVQ